jgi:hypothetical protein
MADCRAHDPPSRVFHLAITQNKAILFEACYFFLIYPKSKPPTVARRAAPKAGFTHSQVFLADGISTGSWKELATKRTSRASHCNCAFVAMSASDGAWAWSAGREVDEVAEFPAMF